VGGRPHLRNARRPRQSSLVLVDDRQRSDDALGSRSDVRGGEGAVSEELGWKAWAKLEETERRRGLDQRGAVAFVGMAVAVVVILLITLWGHLF
jgi:hypothetical protein